MKDLTKGKESSLILKFAMPMLLGNVFQQLYNVVDSVVVGNFIGKEALAAVGSSFPIIFAFLSLIIGIATGSTIVIAQYFGAKDIEKVKRTINTLFIFLIIASITVSIISIYFSEDLFRLLKLPDEIIPQAKIYFNIFMGGILFSFGFNGISAILRGLGDSKTPLYFLIISTLVNIVLDLLFVLVFKWGIAGVAIATVISQCGAFVSAVIYLNRTHKIIRFSIKNLTFDRDIFFKSIRIGLPTGIQQTFVAVGMMALISIVNRFGTNVIAAYSVATRIDSLASMPAMNFSAALSTFVGQNIGAKKIDRVRSGFLATLKMSSILSVIVSAVVLIFGDFIVRLFTTDPEVIRIGKEYLVIVGAFYIVFSSMFVIAGVMRGAGDTLIPMFISLIALWVIRIPVAWVLSREIGEAGIWWAIPIGWSVGIILSYIYYKTGNWKKKSVI
ncbi:MAG: MATE family efflux transporter [Bacteroidetes bacterium GWC2_33_15]|nr:MAG: MATE family efflux transporter [Bacteroidetes bacterium GWA2_33_15]OFX51043.1 MAG: MATE family efflux transporter [Bacteroidetes bacterium GWC2_33_15]OFX65666.1 MAG: MATE family efflux transporter [Bacteroidetes bacterium GWB2_32_14]OFX70251.1 MAG: MATE family efflux transporter [Bacteroidetes bacterium GWD2_33_33]HAN17247.1 MATE family efflux transporter [Bacteroidales bacterium]